MAVIKKEKSDAISNTVMALKFGQTGLEMVCEYAVTTHRFNSLFSMRTFSVDKVDYIAVGGFKSMILLKFKETSMTLVQEFINIHSGPIVDINFNRKTISTVCNKDLHI